MPTFGPASEAQLGTAHQDLQRLFREVVRHFDCKVLEGHRGQEAQDRAFREGRSKLKWPNGNHNAFPSRAVDVAPFPVDWADVKRFHFFAGFVLGLAQSMGLKISWGGAWSDLLDGDRGDLNGPGVLQDLPHFELLA